MSNQRGFSLVLVVVLVLFLGLIAIGIYLITHSNIQSITSFNNKNTSSSTNFKHAHDIPEGKNQDIYSVVLRRSKINNQANIAQSSTYSNGFYNQSILNLKNKPTVGLNLIKPVYADDQSNVSPALFYINNDTQVLSVDLSTNIKQVVLDLTDFNEISHNSGTRIVKQFFINSTKKIAFHVVEKLDENNYKTSFWLYDLANHKLKNIISTSGGLGDKANWNGFSVSPDEKYVFMLYVNPYENDPFSDVPNVVTENSSYYDNTYFFYDITNNQITKFKTNQRLVNAIGTQWSDDSNSVLINYNNVDNQLVFFKVQPNNQSTELFKKPVNNQIQKSQYLQQFNKIFYIASGSNSNDTTFHEEHFGYIDLQNLDFHDLTDSGHGTSEFFYDYQSSVIFDTFKRVNGIITERKLNKYNLTTGAVSLITDKDFALFVLGFNGDYNHVLTSPFTNVQSNLYDLDLSTGQFVYLANVTDSYNYSPPKITSGQQTPNPPTPKVFSVKVYLAQQVAPQFATKDTVIADINKRFSDNEINKSFQGEVITYDQTIPTTCERYFNPVIYAPDEFCNTDTPVDLKIAIYHGYPGGGSSGNFMETGDAFSSEATKWNTLLHEIGHNLTSGNHYDDVWSAQQTPICNCSYQSPYLNDILGTGYWTENKFLEHAVQIMNRNTKIKKTSAPPEEITSEVYTDLPDKIRLTLPDGSVGSGQLTIYYPDMTGNMGNGHTPMVISEDKHFPTVSTNGYLTYADLNKQYTTLSPFWKPYDTYPRVLFLALLKLDTGSKTFFGWLDSAVLQMQFFNNNIPTIAFKEKTN